MMIIVCLISVFCLTTATKGEAQGNIDLEIWIYEAESAFEKVDNYTAIFHKQERVNGKLNEEGTIFIKFKKPFKIYFKWMNEPPDNREALYVYGENGNRIRFHQDCKIGKVKLNLDPTGPLAMKGNRHPITHLGFEYILENIKKDLSRAISAGEYRLHDHGEEVIYGRRTKVIEAIFPDNQSEGYYCHTIVLNLDIENKLPIRVRVFDWDDKLVEMYGYEDLKLNPGLTDSDFDPKNLAYKF